MDELSVEIPKLDIDLSALEGLEFPDLSELLKETQLGEPSFDLNGIDQDMAQLLTGFDEQVLSSLMVDQEPLLDLTIDLEVL